MVEDSRTSILLINPTADTLEIVVAACRNFQTDFNIYVCGAEEDPEWVNKVLLQVDKIFKNPKSAEVVGFLDSKEKETYTE